MEYTTSGVLHLANLILEFVDGSPVEHMIIPNGGKHRSRSVTWRCRAIDRRSGEVIEEVIVKARSANEARKRARARFPSYAKIECVEE